MRAAGGRARHGSDGERAAYVRGGGRSSCLGSHASQPRTARLARARIE